jgi:hypothetical protein
LFCSGKVYYELIEERKKRQVKDTVVIRIEQLFPFPFEEVTAIGNKYKNASKIMWVQEEPKNQGNVFFKIFFFFELFFFFFFFWELFNFFFSGTFFLFFRSLELYLPTSSNSIKRYSIEICWICKI